jgi:hypothetical protein
VRTDQEIFLQDEAPAVLMRLEVFRRVECLLREASEAQKPEPAIRIIIEKITEITSPTTGPFRVPVVMSALIDIRKLSCFFGYSVDAVGGIGSYQKRMGDFDIEGLGLGRPSRVEFLSVLQSENVAPSDLEKAYVSTLTYGNKALAHYKTGRLKDTIPMNHIMLSAFGIDHAIRTLVYQAKGLPVPSLPIKERHSNTGIVRLLRIWFRGQAQESGRGN